MDDLRFQVDPEMTKILRQSLEKKSQSVNNVNTTKTDDPLIHNFSLSMNENIDCGKTVEAKPIVIDKSGTVKDYAITTELSNPNPHLIMQPKLYVPRSSFDDFDDSEDESFGVSQLERESKCFLKLSANLKNKISSDDTICSPRLSLDNFDDSEDDIFGVGTNEEISKEKKCVRFESDEKFENSETLETFEDKSINRSNILKRSISEPLSTLDFPDFEGSMTLKEQRIRRSNDSSASIFKSMSEEFDKRNASNNGKKINNRGPSPRKIVHFEEPGYKDKSIASPAKCLDINPTTLQPDAPQRRVRNKFMGRTLSLREKFESILEDVELRTERTGGTRLKAKQFK